MSSEPNKQKYTKKQKFNATPRKPESKKNGHVKSSSRGPKPQPKKVAPSKPIPINEYRCTACDSQVIKAKPTGVDGAGLGRFKCRCGNKTVSVKKYKAPELKAAA